MAWRTTNNTASLTLVANPSYPFLRLRIASSSDGGGRWGLQTPSENNASNQPPGYSGFPWLRSDGGLFAGKTTLGNTTLALAFRTPWSASIPPSARIMQFGSVVVFRSGEDAHWSLWLEGITYPLGVDAPAIHAPATRMVFVLRFDANNNASWCHSTNPARTVHTLGLGSGAANASIAPFFLLGVPDWANRYPSELYELRAYPKALTDADMQSLCAELEAKWPATNPIYPALPV